MDKISRGKVVLRTGFVHRRCPKCGGNIYLDKDHYGWYEQCLQCGYSYLGVVPTADSELKSDSVGQTEENTSDKKN